jgi:hypothetical protein
VKPARRNQASCSADASYKTVSSAEAKACGMRARGLCQPPAPLRPSAIWNGCSPCALRREQILAS